MLLKSLRLAVSAWLALMPFWIVGRAQAQSVSSCTFSMSAIDFGQVDVLPGTAISGSGVLSVRCQTISTVVGSTLFACVTFPTPRQIAGPLASLNYDLYGPSPSTASWSNTTPIQFPITLLMNGGTASTTISAAVLAAQSTAPAGTYSASVTATVVFGLTGCTFGQVYSQTLTFPVRAAVVATCNVSAQNVAFGSVSLLTAPVDATGQISAQCTKGTTFSVGLDGGLSAATNPTLRKMRGSDGSSTITYGLYQDAARTLPWGPPSGASTLAGTGNAVAQRFPVYARIPVQATPIPGTYTDTVVLTVTY